MPAERRKAHAYVNPRYHHTRDIGFDMREQ
jgi:hypothetical protein